jgi:hypothetical protein
VVVEVAAVLPEARPALALLEAARQAAWVVPESAVQAAPAANRAAVVEAAISAVVEAAVTQALVIPAAAVGGSSFAEATASNVSMVTTPSGAAPSVTITYTPTIDQLFGTLSSSAQGVGPGTSLADEASAAKAAYDAGQKATACGDLTTFLNELKAQTGKKLTPSQVQTLTSQAQQLQQAIGC